MWIAHLWNNEKNNNFVHCIFFGEFQIQVKTMECSVKLFVSSRLEFAWISIQDAAWSVCILCRCLNLNQLWIWQIYLSSIKLCVEMKRSIINKCNVFLFFLTGRRNNNCFKCDQPGHLARDCQSDGGKTQAWEMVWFKVWRIFKPKSPRAFPPNFDQTIPEENNWCTKCRCWF